MSKHKVVGFIVIALSTYYIYHFSRLWYLYEFTDILFFMMLPTWEIVLNIIIGIIGVFLGVKIYRQSISIMRGVSTTLGLMLSGRIINLATNW